MLFYKCYPYLKHKNKIFDMLDNTSSTESKFKGNKYDNVQRSCRRTAESETC